MIWTPLYLQTKGYPAQSDRALIESLAPGEGVLGTRDFSPGAGSGLSISLARGRAVIYGNYESDQGAYIVISDSSSQATVNPNSSGLPRIDQVILRVYDSYSGSYGDSANIEVITGTPTVSASLLNRNGAGSLPPNSIRLADVIVASGDSSISLSEIQDRRPLAIRSTQATNNPYFPSYPILSSITGSQTGFIPNNSKVWHTFYLQEKVTLNYFRWKYYQPGVAAGSYRIALYEANGYKIAESAATNFSGTSAVKSEQLTTTPGGVHLNPGTYMVGIGTTGITSAATTPIALGGARVFNGAFTASGADIDATHLAADLTPGFGVGALSIVTGTTLANNLMNDLTVEPYSAGSTTDLHTSICPLIAVCEY